MTNKSVIHDLNELLQQLCDNHDIFSGKLIIFGGDFRQVLPVVKGGERKDQVEASMVSSSLWTYFVMLKLTRNIRARLDPGFVDFLMRVGNGEELTNSMNEIQIPKPMIVRYVSIDQVIEELVNYVYPNMNLFETDPFEMMQRAILCQKNDFVDDINSKLIAALPGLEIVYVSDDRTKYMPDQGDYVDFLNSLEPRGLSQHKLILKRNFPVILLRNINPVEGLCNGTRLICKELTSNVVGGVIASGQFKRNRVWISRIPLKSSRSGSKYLVPFIRRQLLLRLCFAMTINKAQGQTLDGVEIYLRQPVFTHEQLYVALSRAKTGDKVKVLIVPPMFNDPETSYTSNVVYGEVLDRAKSS